MSTDNRLAYCHEQLTKTLKSLTTLADAAIADLVHSLDIECLREGDDSIRQGEPVTASYYLVSGCLRQFLTTTVGKEVSVAFYLENQAVNTAGDIDSEGMSLYSYECVETCYILSCVNAMILELQGVPGEFGDMIRTLFSRHLTALQQTHASLKGQSPEERFRLLYDQQRDLVWRVPQHLLASYIDLTPETFSRYKRKYLKGQ